MPEPLLSIRELSVEFRLPDRRVRAADEVSFDLDAGEVLAVVGESGCGKSVTGLSILGLLPREAKVSGEVLFEGKNLLRLPEREYRRVRGSRIAMIFQDPLTALNPLLTAGYQVAEAVSAHQKLPARAAWTRAVDLLDQVGIPHPAARAKAYPHQLSGGQRQRVMIAMAFACDPQIVIADEPTTALDVTVQEQVLSLMLDLRREKGTSIILITHDMGVVAETADRVLVMYAGQVVETGTVRSVFASPRHPYSQALLASVPSLEGPILRRLPSIAGQPPDLAALPPGCSFAPRCSARHEACDARPGWTQLDAQRGARCWGVQSLVDASG